MEEWERVLYTSPGIPYENLQGSRVHAYVYIILHHWFPFLGIKEFLHIAPHFSIFKDFSSAKFLNITYQDCRQAKQLGETRWSNYIATITFKKHNFETARVTEKFASCSSSTEPMRENHEKGELTVVGTGSMTCAVHIPSWPVWTDWTTVKLHHQQLTI